MRAFPIAVACLSFVGASPALGQDLPPCCGGEDGGGGASPSITNISPPAESLMVSSGGVDLRSQQMAYEEVDLSPGKGAADARIALIRSGMLSGVPGHISPFGNFSHNFNIMAAESRVDIEKGKYDHLSGQDFRMTVRFGGIADTFESPSYTSGFAQKGTGPMATLSYTGNRTDPWTTYTYVAPDGTEVLFRPIGSGDCSQYQRCAFVSRITYPDNTRLDFTYDTGGYWPGNNARLAKVVSSRGFALLFNYSLTMHGWHNITKACLINLAVIEAPSSGACPSGHPQTKTYTFGAPLPSYGAPSVDLTLASVTDAASGATEQFTYTATGNPQTVNMAYYKPGDSNPWVVNEIMPGFTAQGAPKSYVLGQTFAGGRTIGYSYFDPSAVTAGTISDPAGGQYADQAGTVQVDYGFPMYPRALLPPGPVTYQEQRYQATPGPVKITDQLGRETTYDYCNPAIAAQLASNPNTTKCVVEDLVSATNPDGSKLYVHRDVRRTVVRVQKVAKPGSGLADINTYATYACTYPMNPKTCEKPNWLKDANGNIRTFTYAAHGGMETATEPADANGISAVRRFAYAQRYAWVKSGGGYTTGATPIWVLTEERTCRSTATVGNACAGGSADEIVVSYDYGPNSGPNNLYVRGKTVTADGQTRRSCYGYDGMGNQIFQTSPRAGLTSCQ